MCAWVISMLRNVFSSSWWQSDFYAFLNSYHLETAVYSSFTVN